MQRDRDRFRLHWGQTTLGVCTEIGYVVAIILIGASIAFLAALGGQ